MFTSEIWQTLILIIISILFVMALKSCFPHWDTRYWCPGFARKAFLYTIFLIIKVDFWKKTNKDTQYNLHSFRNGHYNHVLHIRKHDIDALDLHKELSFPPFFLWLKLICEMRQTWILVIIIILFVMGITITFSTLGNMILML